MEVSAKYATGRYSQNQDITTSITRCGKGRVALVGLHPEADSTWCKSWFSWSVKWLLIVSR